MYKFRKQYRYEKDKSKIEEKNWEKGQIFACISYNFLTTYKNWKQYILYLENDF